MIEQKSKQKIFALDNLKQVAQSHRAQGYRIVLCHGTFDLMHIGHLRYLQRARREGDVLYVTVTSDRYVNRGPGRPVFAEGLRAESLAALECVDIVAINDAPTAMNVIEHIKPDVYVKGSEYRDLDSDLTSNIRFECDAVEANGGRIFFTDEMRFSSSSLLNQHFGLFPPQISNYLNHFRRCCSAEQVIDQIRRIKKMRVLVVGEAIIDEYHYTSPLGQTGKGNALAVNYVDREKFAGGAIAVANHIAGFAGSVTLVSGLGRERSQEEFVRSNLLKNVEPAFFYVNDAPTLVKRRYVDEGLNKLFEVYFYNDAPLPESVEQSVCSWLREYAKNFDVVVVPDFGNGFISNNMAWTLSECSRFLAVNTQINSGNRGYHVVQRYPKANFISLNEPELRMAARNRHDPLLSLAHSVGGELGASHIAVTRGIRGVLMYSVIDRQKIEIPALSLSVVDRVGAGDAFLSLAGIALGCGLDAEIAAFVGSAAAALDVQIVCNRESVNPSSLFKYITTLFK